MNNKKALVIKLCCLGDIIQVIPTLKALKDNGYEIHYLCIEYVRPLLELIPSVDKIFTINTRSMISILKTIKELNKEKYDLIINLHRDLKSFIFISFIKSKLKVGFKWGISRFFLTKAFEFDCKIHESKRYLSIIEGIGLIVKTPTEKLKIPDTPQEKFEITGNKKIGLFPGGGVNPGTIMYTKRWPIENFIELSEMLIKDGFSVYIFGGLIDKPLIEKLKKAVSEVKDIMTAGIKDFVYYVSKMDVFIAPDTGPLHIAAAVGVKTIGLFGPSDPYLVAPLAPDSIYIKGTADCSPCYVPETVHRKEFLKCKDNICMKSITPEIVYEKIKGKTG
ncbi:MAG: glycosyltransferase family 9 protein [Candidatus Goldbacteria bacterium]|nr:glycosyltransferase family 9 protein [Candidatus Goldiibacteriota bacterium]